jgi:hypothetical protein
VMDLKHVVKPQLWRKMWSCWWNPNSLRPLILRMFWEGFQQWIWILVSRSVYWFWKCGSWAIRHEKSTPRKDVISQPGNPWLGHTLR